MKLLLLLKRPYKADETSQGVAVRGTIAPSIVMNGLCAGFCVVFCWPAIGMLSDDPQSIPALLVLALCIPMAALSASAFRTAHFVNWDENGVDGQPRVSWWPQERNRVKIDWEDVVDVDRIDDDEWCIFDRRGASVCWNEHYTGHATLLAAAVNACPHLFVVASSNPSDPPSFDDDRCENDDETPSATRD